MNLGSQLAQLETAQLVRTAVNEPDEFLFKHALTQDAAYQSLLQKQRREVHRQVARAYEALYGDRCLDDYAAILAQHYTQAGDELKAFDYAARAGETAARMYANSEAVEYYTQAIQIARRLATAPTMHPSLRELYLKLGRVNELSDRYDVALAIYDEMGSVARTRHDRSMELAALIARATIYAIPSRFFDIERAKAMSVRALELAREIGDKPAEAKALWNMILFNSRLDTSYRQALAYGEQAIAIAREYNLREQLAYLLNDVSTLYVWLGDPERGAATNLEAREMFRAMNNLPMLTDNFGYAIMAHIALGEYSQATEVSRESLEISRRIGNEWGETFIQSWVGAAYRELGEIDQAILAMENSIRLAEHSFQAPLSFTRSDVGALYGDLGQVEQGLKLAQLASEAGERIAPVMHIYCAGQLAHLQILSGDLASAEATVDEALDRTKRDDDHSMFGRTIHAANAELRLAQGDSAQAIQASERLINLLRSYRLRQFLANALWIKGLALTRQAKFDEAFVVLQQARKEAEETKARWVLWRILAALAEVEQAQGKIDQAQELRTQARANLDFIRAHTPQAFRQTFEKLPHVRAVMEAQ